MTMTTEMIAAIRERAERATPGPWQWEMLRRGVMGADTLVAMAVWGDEVTEQYIAISDADAEFIAHAREDIPKLLAEIERLQAELKYYKYALGVEGDE